MNNTQLITERREINPRHQHALGPGMEDPVLYVELALDSLVRREGEARETPKDLLYLHHKQHWFVRPEEPHPGLLIRQLKLRPCSSSARTEMIPFQSKPEPHFARYRHSEASSFAGHSLATAQLICDTG